MNAKDKAKLKNRIYKIIGAVVDLEEFESESTESDEAKEIRNFVLTMHESVNDLVDNLKIEL